MYWSAARIRAPAGPQTPWLDISPAPYYHALPHRPTLDRFGLLATKPGTKGGHFGGARSACGRSVRTRLPMKKIWSRLTARRISLAVPGGALLLAAAAVLQASSAASAPRRAPRGGRRALHGRLRRIGLLHRPARRDLPRRPRHRLRSLPQRLQGPDPTPDELTGETTKYPARACCPGVIITDGFNTDSQAPERAASRRRDS
jgi:hypothetical protein